MSLVAELQHSNVLRVAIAHVAGAWLLIQIADTLFPISGVGDAALRIVVAVLVAPLYVSYRPPERALDTLLKATPSLT